MNPDEKFFKLASCAGVGTLIALLVVWLMTG